MIPPSARSLCCWHERIKPESRARVKDVYLFTTNKSNRKGIGGDEAFALCEDDEREEVILASSGGLELVGVAWAFDQGVGTMGDVGV